MSTYTPKVFDPISCPTCSKEFTPKRSDTVFCSTKCAQRAKYARNPYNPETFGSGTTANRGRTQDPEHVKKRALAVKESLSKTVRSCDRCQGQFTPTNAAQRYCSGQCWTSVARQRKPAGNRIKLHSDHYAELHRLQDGKCAVCGSESGLTGRGRLAVDHCHEGGYIRGLLCHRCNTAIGLFRDDTASLKKAIEYLDTARARMTKSLAH